MPEPKRELSAVLAAIDAVLAEPPLPPICSACSAQLSPDGPSDFYCSEQCQKEALSAATRPIVDRGPGSGDLVFELTVEDVLSPRVARMLDQLAPRVERRPWIMATARDVTLRHHEQADLAAAPPSPTTWSLGQDQWVDTVLWDRSTTPPPDHPLVALRGGQLAPITFGLDPAVAEGLSQGRIRFESAVRTALQQAAAELAESARTMRPLVVGERGPEMVLPPRARATTPPDRRPVRSRLLRPVMQLVAWVATEAGLALGHLLYAARLVVRHVRQQLGWEVREFAASSVRLVRAVRGRRSR